MIEKLAKKPTENLTDRRVKSLPPPAKGNRITYDGEVSGFGCRVTAAGARAFVLTYRRKADGLDRRLTLGSFPDWGTGAARDEARRLKRLIDGGADPVGDSKTDRAAPTVNDLLDRFEQEFIPRLRPASRKDYRITIWPVHQARIRTPQERGRPPGASALRQ